jgi:hypothetical protein
MKSFQSFAALCLLQTAFAIAIDDAQPETLEQVPEIEVIDEFPYYPG